MKHALFIASFLLALGCGGRSNLLDGDPEPPPVGGATYEAIVYATALDRIAIVKHEDESCVVVVLVSPSRTDDPDVTLPEGWVLERAERFERCPADLDSFPSAGDETSNEVRGSVGFIDGDCRASVELTVSFESGDEELAVSGVSIPWAGCD
jgi:hypothetical protein